MEFDSKKRIQNAKKYTLIYTFVAKISFIQEDINEGKR